MAAPQVHAVAMADDIGLRPADGALMLSLMYGFGIVSRLGSGWISDRIGGLRTLALGSAGQTAALLLFLQGIVRIVADVRVVMGLPVPDEIYGAPASAGPAHGEGDEA